MRLPDSFTPARATIGGLLLIGLILAIVFFNPWTGFLRGQVESARADEETAIDGWVSAEQQIEGQSVVEAAATEVRVIVQDARENAYAVEREARAAPDADAPLDPAVADRLRRSDDVLCGLRPGICARRPDAPAAGPDLAP